MITPLGSKTIEEYRERLTNLKLQKIDLGINDELESATKKAYEYRRDVLDLISKADDNLRSAEVALDNLRELKSELQDVSDELNDTMGELNALTRNAATAADNLGISPSDLPNYDDAYQAIEDAAKTGDESNEIDARIREFV